ncbi:hypothetical protein Tco_0516711 [Tanacetum coccineum]
MNVLLLHLIERRDEKKRLDHLKHDLRLLVIKRFRERKKIFRERKLSEKLVQRGEVGSSKVEEKLVHLRMVVKFEVLIEKKKTCSLGLMKFDWWMEFLMVHLEELEMKKLL